MEIETKGSNAPKNADCEQMQTSTYPNHFLYGFLFGILATILLIGGYYAVIDLFHSDGDKIGVWEVKNDYNGESTDCFWVVNQENNKIDYVAYEDGENQEVLTSFPYKVMTGKEFKEKNPTVKFYMNQKNREPYNLPNSENILVAGPLKDESETFGYPVYVIMFPGKDKSEAFINTPDGALIFLSYATLTKLHNLSTVARGIKKSISTQKYLK